MIAALAAVEAYAKSPTSEQTFAAMKALIDQVRQQAVSDVVLAPRIADLRARVEVARARARHGQQRARMIVDVDELALLLDALDPATRP